MAYSDKALQNAYNCERNALRRQYYFKLMGGKCVIYGATQNLELDHKDKTTKISHKIWSWAKERLEAELVKCQLLCRRCHTAKTTVERNYPARTHGTLTMYKRGKCRCEPCKKANSDYEHKRRGMSLVIAV